MPRRKQSPLPKAPRQPRKGLLDEQIEGHDTTIMELERLAALAESSRQFAAAVTATSRLGTLRQERARAVVATRLLDERDDLVRVRKLVAVTFAEGSMAATAALIAQEREIRRERAAAEQAESERKRLSGSTAEAVEAVVTMFQAMDPSLQHQLIERLVNQGRTPEAFA